MISKRTTTVTRPGLCTWTTISPRKDPNSVSCDFFSFLLVYETRIYLLVVHTLHIRIHGTRVRLIRPWKLQAKRRCHRVIWVTYVNLAAIRPTSLSVCTTDISLKSSQPFIMGFAVLPALVTDIPAVYDAYFAAFKTSAITRAFFPSATEDEMMDSQSEFRYDRHRSY